MARTVKFLTAGEEIALAAAWQDHGDEAAMHKLVMSYEPMALKAARQYKGFPVDVEDLESVARIGLLRAANTFDRTRGTRFSSCAYWWIRSELREFIVRASLSVGHPSSARHNLANFRRPDLSLDAPATADGSMTFADLLQAPEVDVDGNLDAHTRTVWVRDAVQELPEREAHIITARYLQDDAVTLAELGEHYGISKERVRQLEHRAIDELAQAAEELGMV